MLNLQSLGTVIPVKGSCYSHVEPLLPFSAHFCCIDLNDGSQMRILTVGRAARHPGAALNKRT